MAFQFAIKIRNVAGVGPAKLLDSRILFPLAKAIFALGMSRLITAVISRVLLVNRLSFLLVTMETMGAIDHFCPTGTCCNDLILFSQALVTLLYPLPVNASDIFCAIAMYFGPAEYTLTLNSEFVAKAFLVLP